MATFDCSKFYDYFYDNTPHYTAGFLKDRYPWDDAWFGKIRTEKWPSFNGTTYVRNRFHMAYPDTKGCWTNRDYQNQECAACDPPTKAIGWGWNRTTFSQEWIRYQTNVLCFDQMNTQTEAWMQAQQVIKGLNDSTRAIWSDKLRSDSLFKNSRIYLAGADRAEIDIVAGTITADCTEINLGSEANVAKISSQLTMPYLQSFYEYLQSNGYFDTKYVPDGMFMMKLDPITVQQLTTGNPELANQFRWTDFSPAGQLSKYGINRAIGNIGFEYDKWPMRFYPVGAGRLRRVFPFENVPTTVGIRRKPSALWLNAPIQYSPIWNPDAMVRYSINLEQVNPRMPFITRDLAGAWKFIGPDSLSFVAIDPDTGDECVIDNKAGNKGMFFADFVTATEMQYPEITIPILHLREPGCVINLPRCSATPAYSAQNTASGNQVCLTE